MLETPCSLYISESGPGIIDGNCFACNHPPDSHDEFMEKRPLLENLIRLRNYIEHAEGGRQFEN